MDVALAGDVGATGIVVDAVSAVIELDSDHVEEAPSFGLAVSAEYLRGMARLGERFLPILDLGFVLGADGPIAARACSEGESAEGL